MGGANGGPHGPDLSIGVSIDTIPEGSPFGGHVGDKQVVLVRRGQELFAIGGMCTHYSGPLDEGIVVGDTIRCPWHHACFDLRTGEAKCAPALDPVARWEFENVNGRVRVLRELPKPDGATPLEHSIVSDSAQHDHAASSIDTAGKRPGLPQRIVIIGAGAAGHAAAEMLRRQGYSGELTLCGAEDTVPIDRPNLSKDYLAGTAQAEWIPLRPEEFYAEHAITLRRNSRVQAIDVAARQVRFENGDHLEYDRLLLATGAEPIRLPMPGNDLPHVHYLRTLRDSDAIIANAGGAKRALVMGASFIGLEVAASLRQRGLDVHVVAPEAIPLERVLGADVGSMIRSVHEEHGVVFHLGQVAERIEPNAVILKSGERIEADLVVIGVGVSPVTSLAESAGLEIDRGVRVNEFLETSVPGIYAAGDIARWPDKRSGEPVRVEHWVVAQRMGQAAARNMLRADDARERFSDVPYFWSAHFDVSILYTGHAQRWDDIHVDGDIKAHDAAIAYRLGGRVLAVATIGRDTLCLQAEEALSRDDQGALKALLHIP